jgi:hypothetical protein
MMLQQPELFGGTTEVAVNYTLEPHLLPKPQNDWAVALYIILNTPKGVTAFDAASKWGIIKFQERLNEILKQHPQVAVKKNVKVRKRLNRKVDAMLYTVADKQKAVDVFFELNKRGGSKTLK